MGKSISVDTGNAKAFVHQISLERRRMKQMSGLLLLVAFALPSSVVAQREQADPLLAAPANAPKGSVAIPIYGKDNPGRLTDEIETRFMGRETVIRNITYPTLTPVFPKRGKANGTAVIVAPGGGFAMLSMQNEGWRIAQKLADRGITAFVLKYRLNPTPRDDAEWMREMSKMFAAPRAPGKRPDIKDPGAGQDGLAALRLVRARAVEWKINPRRVGMIGFSAGAMTAMRSLLEAPTPDDAPDFMGYIYGQMDKIDVPPKAPPMFAALAIDDPLFGSGDMGLIPAWHAAKRPVEAHIYSAGGHGYGMGRPGTTSMLMMDQFLAWMDAQGLMAASKAQ
jgi:acetyl esterase/lipase